MALRRSRLALVVLALVLLASAAAGLQFEASGTLGAWTVRAGSSSADQALRSIVSDTSVQVFVRYTPSSDAAALATIRVQDTGIVDSRKPPDISSPAHGELHISSDASVGAVDIVVHGEQLSQVKAESHGDVVVDQGVFVVNDPLVNVTATASGSGSVYLPPQLRLNVAGLSLQSHSYGSVYLTASGITVGTLDVAVTSGGDVKFHADSIDVHGALDVRVSSHGSATISTTTLQATSFDVKTSSTGDAVLTVSGGSSRVAQCDYQLPSVGSIEAGTVVCTNATVTNSGVGHAIVQATDSLTYSISSFGSIYYAGALPSVLTATSHGYGQSLKAAKPSALSDPSWAEPYTLPPRPLYPEERVAATSMTASAAPEPKAHDTPTTKTTNAKTTQPRPHFPWGIVGLVALIVALFMAEKSCQRRRHERSWPDEKTRLKQEEEPVYI